MKSIIKTIIFSFFLIFFSYAGSASSKEVNWDELLKAKNFYESGLCEFTRYHLTLNKNYLAEAISLFKDGIAVDPNFSKNYYALVSALEEYEAGSSQVVGDNLRELLENMFDPFVSGGEAAYELGSIELLGICMERIRTLESALNYCKKHGVKLNQVIYEKLVCPCGGKYTVEDGKDGVVVKCSLHSTPTDRSYLKEDYSKTIERFNSKAFQKYKMALSLYGESTLTTDINEIKKMRIKSANLFLKSTKLDKNLIEGYIGYMHLAPYGHLTKEEYELFEKKYRELSKNFRLKRYGRLAAGDFIDIGYRADCFITKLMIKSGVKLYLLNKGKINPEKLDLDILVRKGYLKSYPFCKCGGKYKIVKNGKDFNVYCTVHDKEKLKK